MGTIWSRRLSRRDVLRASALAAGTLWLTSCSGGPGPAQPTEPSASSTSPSKTPEPTDTVVPTVDPKVEAASTVSLDIGTATGKTEFKYNKDTLEASAGSKIKLTFTNNTNKMDEVGHNWVLVKPGQEDSVVANGKNAGDTVDYLQSGDPGVIAHTRLIEGEQKDTIVFDAPPPGKYTYLSTFPDQYASGMKGTFTIK